VSTEFPYPRIFDGGRFKSAFGERREHDGRNAGTDPKSVFAVWEDNFHGKGDHFERILVEIKCSILVPSRPEV
jgi:hypothetical protein